MCTSRSTRTKRQIKALVLEKVAVGEASHAQLQRLIEGPPYEKKLYVAAADGCGLIDLERDFALLNVLI